MTRTLRLALALVAALTLVLTLTAGPATAAGKKPAGDFWLTILHNNDGESQLLNAGAGLEDFGGVARFKTLVDNLKADATTGKPSPQQRGMKRGVVMLSSGDNFLAGPEFNASLDKGVPFFDTIAMDLIGYDAVAIGNHDFDFGPDVLADFIRGFESDVPYLSANLDFSAEPALQALVDAGRIAGSTVVKERGERVGIVGATTPLLRFISSPRNVGIDPDVAGAINDEVDALEAKGVNKIILISHLQSIEEDLALAPMLSGVDVMIAGGGDELLANPGDRLVPGDEGIVFGPYPLIATDGDGNDVPVITTPGSYKYVGELGVAFDKAGNVVGMNSGPVRVSGVGPDAVEPDPVVQAEVTEPVAEALETLDENVVATSEVDLDGRRGPGVRTMETNEGNLIADSFLYQGTKLAASFGVDAPQVALQNGGGIRNDSIIPAGPITELDTFDMVPFANFLSIVEDVPAAQFKEILENAVSRVEFTDGRFAQIGGFSYTYDAAGTAQVLNADGTVATPGTRVREVVLDDGTVVVSGGSVVPMAASIDVATIDFLARGGDQYPFRGLPFTTLGLTYQQALEGYLVEADGLNGTITAAQYPEGGEGRITRLN
jgi:5'-nucleotidase